MNSSPPRARSTASCCPAFTSCRFISRPLNGWRAGRESSIPHALHCSAICRKPGGKRTKELEASPMILGEASRTAATAVPRSMIFFAAPACASPMPLRSPTRPTAQLYRWRAAQADLCAGRPGDLGDRAKLRGLGLQTDAVVAMQLPNTVESIVTFLGVLRAGMIAAPLPLLWRSRISLPRSAASAPKPS